MKHPFYTLYYTGLALLISILLVSGLLISNLSNIVDLIPKEKKPKVQSNVVINPMVLETSTPKPTIKLDNPKIDKKGITNTEILKSNTEDTNNTHNNINNNNPNTLNNQEKGQSDTSIQGIGDTKL